MNDAIARMNVNDGGGSCDGTKGGLAATASDTALLMPTRSLRKSPSNQQNFAINTAYRAAMENLSDDDAEAGYAQVQEVYPGAEGGVGADIDQMYTFSQDTTPNKSKMRQRRALDKPPPGGGGMLQQSSKSNIVCASQ